jgi:hypothetical protein
MATTIVGDHDRDLAERAPFDARRDGACPAPDEHAFETALAASAEVVAMIDAEPEVASRPTGQFAIRGNRFRDRIVLHQASVAAHVNSRCAHLDSRGFGANAQTRDDKREPLGASAPRGPKSRVLMDGI